MLANVIGGVQGIIDHALVGNLVGYTANAAIGVSVQLWIVVIVFISSIFIGMSVMVSPLCRGRRGRKGKPHGLSGIFDRDLHVVRHSCSDRLYCGSIPFGPGKYRSRGKGRGIAVPSRDVCRERRNADLFYARRCPAFGRRCSNADGPRHRDDRSEPCF